VGDSLSSDTQSDDNLSDDEDLNNALDATVEFIDQSNE
jgi:hypothetical protein